MLFSIFELANLNIAAGFEYKKFWMISLKI